VLQPIIRRWHQGKVRMLDRLSKLAMRQKIAEAPRFGHTNHLTFLLWPPPGAKTPRRSATSSATKVPPGHQGHSRLFSMAVGQNLPAMPPNDEKGTALQCDRLA